MCEYRFADENVKISEDVYSADIEESTFYHWNIIVIRKFDSIHGEKDQKYTPK